MGRSTFVTTLKMLYTFYTAFIVLAVLLVARSAYDLLAIPPLLLFMYLLYARDKRNVLRRRTSRQPSHTAH